jgi:hypothetical protein
VNSAAWNIKSDPVTNAFANTDTVNPHNVAMCLFTSANTFFSPHWRQRVFTCEEICIMCCTVHLQHEMLLKLMYFEPRPIFRPKCPRFNHETWDFLVSTRVYKSICLTQCLLIIFGMYCYMQHPVLRHLFPLFIHRLTCRLALKSKKFKFFFYFKIIFPITGALHISTGMVIIRCFDNCC